jgi:hypothetical protein
MRGSVEGIFVLRPPTESLLQRLINTGHKIQSVVRYRAIIRSYKFTTSTLSCWLEYPPETERFGMDGTIEL